MSQCPLDLCDGSGFVRLPDNEENNCPHENPPSGGWTPEVIQAFEGCFYRAHPVGEVGCPWCGPDGVRPNVKA